MVKRRKDNDIKSKSSAGGEIEKGREVVECYFFKKGKKRRSTTSSSCT